MFIYAFMLTVKTSHGVPAAQILCLSTVGPRFSNKMQKLILSRSLSNSPVLLLISPGKTLLTLCPVQEWPDSWNETLVILFMDTSMRDSSLSPLFAKLLRVLESASLDNPPSAAVIPVARAPFPTTLFPSTQLPVNTH